MTQQELEKKEELALARIKKEHEEHERSAAIEAQLRAEKEKARLRDEQAKKREAVTDYYKTMLRNSWTGDDESFERNLPAMIDEFMARDAFKAIERNREDFKRAVTDMF